MLRSPALGNLFYFVCILTPLVAAAASLVDSKKFPWSQYDHPGIRREGMLVGASVVITVLSIALQWSLTYLTLPLALVAAGFHLTGLTQPRMHNQPMRGVLAATAIGTAIVVGALGDAPTRYLIGSGAIFDVAIFGLVQWRVKTRGVKQKADQVTPVFARGQLDQPEVPSPGKWRGRPTLRGVFGRVWRLIRGPKIPEEYNQQSLRLSRAADQGRKPRPDNKTGDGRSGKPTTLPVDLSSKPGAQQRLTRDKASGAVTPQTHDVFPVSPPPAARVRGTPRSSRPDGLPNRGGRGSN